MMRRRSSASWLLPLSAGFLAASMTACSNLQPVATQDSGGNRPGLNNQNWRPAGPVGPQQDTLGLKWNWSQPQTAPFVESMSGGVTFQRTEWCSLQPGEHVQPQFKSIDAIVERPLALNYAPMLKIRIGACWANGRSEAEVDDPSEGTRSTPSALPTDLDAYAAYVSQFASHYRALGVRRFAIENEVDTAAFWDGTAAEYNTLARTASAAIRAAAPDAVILDGGVSSTGLGVAIAADLLKAGRQEEALAFYSQYYARRLEGGASRFPRVSRASELVEVVDGDAGVRARSALNTTFVLARDGVIDAFQLHFYEDPSLIPAVVAYLRERLPAGVPIEAWETGVAWPGDGYDPQQHADDTLHVLAGLLAEGVGTAVYLPVAYTDSPGKQQVFRGLIEPDGTSLPAADAYRLVRGMVGSGWQRVDGAGLLGIVADDLAGSKAVVWSPGRGAVVLPAEGQMTAQTLDGQQIASPVRIGGRPVIVSWSGSRQSLAELLAAAAPSR